MTEVGAGPEAMIATLDHTEYVKRIPDLVIGLGHRSTMFMKRHAHIELDGGGFPCGDKFGLYRVFMELEYKGNITNRCNASD